MLTRFGTDSDLTLIELDTMKKIFAIAIASGGDEAAMLSALDGKTADEIIAYAKSLAD